MNLGAEQTREYAKELLTLLQGVPVQDTEIYVLPPFTSLYAAREAFGGSPVAYGGQNMHWMPSGSWTGEISADMLLECGCRYVELAHSERLQHFGESYALVRQKVDLAMEKGLTPIICLGESAQEKKEGRSDEVLATQVMTSLAGQDNERISEVILAYEPRWAISGAEAAPPEYIAQRHEGLRKMLAERWGEKVAEETRIIYGGSVTPENGVEIMKLKEVDGLFVGRAAWTPQGFAQIVKIVVEAAKQKSAI